MTLKKIKIWGVILAFVFCFGLHFLYDFLPNFLTSVIAPVNESIWEHMKILFGSIMLSSVVQKIIAHQKKLEFNNLFFSNFVGALLAIPIFLIIYLPIYYIIFENMVVSITVMFVTLVISQIISYKIMEKEPLHLEKLTILLVFLVYLVFGIFTYYPLENDLFYDKKNEVYGIEKSQ